MRVEINIGFSCVRRKRIANSVCSSISVDMVNLIIVKGFFYVTCTLDMRLDFIGQHLVYAFFKKEVWSVAPQNRLQSTI